MGCGIVSARGAGTELSEIRGMVDFSFLSTVHHSTMIWENICICDQIKKLVSRSHFSFLSVSDLWADIGKNIANKLKTGARKTAKTARFRRAAGKIELTAATAPKFWSFNPLELSGLIKKQPRYGPFLPKISFHLPTKRC